MIEAMEERSGAVTFKGGPMTLVGPEASVGAPLPDATLTTLDMRPISLGEDGKGKARMIVTVPSVDTSVCSLESKKFSDAVRSFDPEKMSVYIVSADLPFALKRWSEEEGVDNVTLLSGYKDMGAAKSWGLYLKELGLFARAVYVTNPEGEVTYREIVPEVASEPNYAAALDALRAAAE